ncbi:MAG TPA: carboxypeptidase-like regulatory domain-containing protein, partial [Candidatus Solibacter sp.]|nr:carboxypeptidase-like regulatory domain-containing protein [Candidatus Solibacter sp.]
MRGFSISAFLFMIICSAPLARGQSASGEIAGSVLDDSGAAIPKAAVTVLNTDTGLERRFETDSLGNYIFTQLSPGNYSIQVEKSGFQRFVREGITLQVGQRARIDVPLRVGAVSESVSINAQTGLLDVEEASLGQVIENRKILDLPMNGRNLIGLAALTTGVSPGVGFGMGIPDGRQALVNAATASFLINGGMGAHNDVLMDGIPLAVCCQNQIALIPSIDTTQEFRVRTNLYDAQFGRTSGGLVTFASKAGTNAFHGGLYEFLRNRNLDANNFFNNRAGISKAPFSYNQYGLRAGGPVIRNKTFFFFNYEAIRNRKGSFLSGNVPTAAERQGIFSVPVFDSASTRLQNGVYSRDPFPGNRVPAGRFDPVAVKLTDLWPLPNTTGANNFLSNASAGDNQDQYNVRVDHHFSPRHQIFGRVSISNTNGTLPDWFRTIGSPDTWEQFTNNRNAVLEDTLTLSPSTVMTFRYGFT